MENNFENKLSKLEEIVSMLEGSEISLDEAIKLFEKALYKQWHIVNKPFGYDVQQMRIGGMLMRLEMAKQRIEEYLCGTLDRLEELEVEDLPFIDGACKLRGANSWRRSFTRSQITWS